MKANIDRCFYGALYRTGLAPWEIDRPQPSLIEIEAAGHITGTALDLGCGKGANAVFLAERGYDVTGIDLVAAAIRAARRRATSRGLPLRFLVRDVFELDETRRYDTLIDFGLLHHFDETTAEAYLEKVARLANVDGSLIFQCFSELAPSWLGLAPRRFTESGLRKLFAGSWDLRELQRTEFQLKWGGSSPAWRGMARRRA